MFTKGCGVGGGRGDWAGCRAHMGDPHEGGWGHLHQELPKEAPYWEESDRQAPWAPVGIRMTCAGVSWALHTWFWHQ